MSNVNTTNNALSTSSAFFPKNYTVPDKSKQFMKLALGDNEIRILSSPMLGYVLFSTENKPIRKQFHLGDFTKSEMIEFKAKKNEDGSYEGSRHFWIMLVWDFQENIPRILEITQTGILKSLFSYTEMEKWGDLRKFNVIINRVGSGKTDTEYAVTPNPHEELNPAIVAEINTLVETGMLDLEAIWRGEYPFENYNY